jgi:O-methyltransferase involved in polyketide biosynthesis
MTDSAIQIELGDPLQDTLLLPLVGRAKATDMLDPLLDDEKARALVARFGARLDQQIRSVDLYTTICYAARALRMDAAVREFAELHPRAAIIDIGSGLDTMFYRVDNSRIRWYDLDLPDVIHLRGRLLPAGPRNCYLGKSLFDTTWFEAVAETGSGVFMLAAGVLMYYSEREVKEFLVRAAEHFPGAQILFDVLSRRAIAESNEMMSRSRGRNIAFRWGLDSAQEILGWSSRIRVVSQTPYFSHIVKRPEWGSAVLEQMTETDQDCLASFIHLEFI